MVQISHFLEDLLGCPWGKRSIGSDPTDAPCDWNWQSFLPVQHVWEEGEKEFFPAATLKDHHWCVKHFVCTLPVRFVISLTLMCFHFSSLLCKYQLH